MVFWLKILLWTIGISLKLLKLHFRTRKRLNKRIHLLLDCLIELLFTVFTGDLEAQGLLKLWDAVKV